MRVLHTQSGTSKKISSASFTKHHSVSLLSSGLLWLQTPAGEFQLLNLHPNLLLPGSSALISLNSSCPSWWWCPQFPQHTALSLYSAFPHPSLSPGMPFLSASLIPLLVRVSFPLSKTGFPTDVVHNSGQ